MSTGITVGRTGGYAGYLLIADRLAVGTFLKLWALALAVTVAALLGFARSWDPVGLPQDTSSVAAVAATYRSFGALLKRPRMQVLVAVLLCTQFGTPFTYTTALRQRLRLAGFSADALYQLELVSLPFGVAAAALAGAWITKKSPPERVAAWRRLLPYRGYLGGVLLVVAVVGWPLLRSEGGTLVSLVVACLILVEKVLSSVVAVVRGAFFMHIVDPTVAGTSLTLLNTMGNLGYFLPRYPVTRLIAAAEPADIFVPITALLCVAWFACLVLFMRPAIAAFGRAQAHEWHAKSATKGPRHLDDLL